MPPKIPPKKAPREQAKVLFSYTAENDDELTIKEGDIVTIIAKEVEDKGWMQAELNNKIGLIPDNFIQIIKPTPISLTTNNVLKNTSVTNNFNSLNGTKTVDDNSPPRLPIKKPAPESKLSKVISSKFNEIISKSNNSLNESTQRSSLFLKQPNSDEKAATTISPTTTTNSVTSVAPSLPLKKAKLFGTPKPSFQNKDSSDETFEKVTTAESDLNSFIDEQEANSSIKLTHLTASRVKGPTNRRPPSIIQVPKDDEHSLASSNSLNNLSDLSGDKKETHLSSDHSEDSSSLSQTNKELSKQSSKNNSVTEMSKVTTPTSLANQQPPWMVELKKTQAEKKNEVKMKTKNCSIGDESNMSASVLNQSNQTTSLTSFNGTSPLRKKKFKESIITPHSPTKLTANRMSGDYSQRFKDFLQTQSTSNTNSLSRHSTVNNHFNNSSRTLSTDSLDCKEPTSMLGFGQLNSISSISSPFASVVKPIKAAKPTAAKFMSISPTTTGQSSILNSNSTNQTTVIASPINQTKDAVSRKEFDDLQKKVNDLSDTLETQKQTYKGLIKDLINDIAEEKKKVANLTIEVDRLRKLTTTV